MITIHLLYKGTNGSARDFAEEMESSGVVTSIRNEPGNLRYAYYQSMDDPETVLLIDSWRDQTDGHRCPSRFSHDGEDCRTAGEVRPAHDCGAVYERRPWSG